MQENGCVDCGETEPDDTEDALDELENTEDTLKVFRSSNSNSMLVPLYPQSHCEFLEIAPGEGKNPLNVLTDEFCEEKEFLYLLPSGRFGFFHKRKQVLSPAKYFNQRLLNYTQRFASCPDYIFFAHFFAQKHALNSSINIACKKVTGNLKASFFSNYKGVSRFVASNQGFQFMNKVKGSPSYWKTFLNDTLAMVKQLGCPTFFLTISCADLRWDELVVIIKRLDGVDYSYEDAKKLTYKERVEILNSNPVLLARFISTGWNAFLKILFWTVTIR